MGSYTRLELKCRLNKDTPEEIINILKKTIIDGEFGQPEGRVLFGPDEIPTPPIDHDFFKCERWYMLLLSNDWGSSKGSEFIFDRWSWVLTLDTQFKNYDDEIEKFLDWIMPHVSGRKKKKYLGYWKPEDYDQEINIYKELPPPPKKIPIISSGPVPSFDPSKFIEGDARTGKILICSTPADTSEETDNFINLWKEASASPNSKLKSGLQSYFTPAHNESLINKYGNTTNNTNRTLA